MDENLTPGPGLQGRLRGNLRLGRSRACSDDAVTVLVRPHRWWLEGLRGSAPGDAPGDAPDDNAPPGQQVSASPEGCSSDLAARPWLSRDREGRSKALRDTSEVTRRRLRGLLWATRHGGDLMRLGPRSAVTCSAFLAVCRECTEVQRDVRTVTADGVCAVVTLGPPNFRLYLLMQSMSLSLTCVGKSSLGSVVVCEALGSPETQTSEPPAW